MNQIKAIFLTFLVGIGAFAMSIINVNMYFSGENAEKTIYVINAFLFFVIGCSSYRILMVLQKTEKLET